MAAGRSLPALASNMSPIPSIPSSMMFLPLFDGMGLSDLPLTQNGGINRMTIEDTNVRIILHL